MCSDWSSTSCTPSLIIFTIQCTSCIIFFFFNDTATTEIYTLSLHDALPISFYERIRQNNAYFGGVGNPPVLIRSEEHTSELQSLAYLVCRLLLEKKKHRLRHQRASPAVYESIASPIPCTSTKTCRVHCHYKA